MILNLYIEICPHKSKRPLLVSGVYRPPSAKKEYNIILGKNIENAYLENKELIILGDFNIDYLNPDSFLKSISENTSESKSNSTCQVYHPTSV